MDLHLQGGISEVQLEIVCVKCYTTGYEGLSLCVSLYFNTFRGVDLVLPRHSRRCLAYFLFR